MRCASRRPGTKKFVSDRGTNLTSADKILKRELEQWNEASSDELRRKGLEWSFIPANTPHYGGVWERIVGLFKRHLSALTTGQPLHVDALNTLIVEIEGVVNRRPLTALSTNPEDLTPITPAHILYPAVFAHSSSILVPVTTSSQAEDVRSSWKTVQSRVNAFWKTWSREYVTLLHNRPKWSKTRKNLKIGDLVLIVDEQLRRCEWKLGRVVKPIAKGEHVRKIEVRCIDGKNILRDRTKIVLLELDGEENDDTQA